MINQWITFLTNEDVVVTAKVNSVQGNKIYSTTASNKTFIVDTNKIQRMDFLPVDSDQFNEKEMQLNTEKAGIIIDALTQYTLKEFEKILGLGLPVGYTELYEMVAENIYEIEKQQERENEDS